MINPEAPIKRGDKFTHGPDYLSILTCKEIDGIRIKGTDGMTYLAPRCAKIIK